MGAETICTNDPTIDIEGCDAMTEPIRILRRVRESVYRAVAVSITREIRMRVFSHVPRVYYRITKR